MFGVRFWVFIIPFSSTKLFYGKKFKHDLWFPDLGYPFSIETKLAGKILIKNIRRLLIWCRLHAEHCIFSGNYNIITQKNMKNVFVDIIEQGDSTRF